MVVKFLLDLLPSRSRGQLMLSVRTKLQLAYVLTPLTHCHVGFAFQLLAALCLESHSVTLATAVSTDDT